VFGLRRKVAVLTIVIPIVVSALMFGPWARTGQDAGTYQLVPNWAQIPSGAWGVM
jgi:hypothetical protein